MKELPEAAIYESALKYWPYGASLEHVLDLVEELAPENGNLLDIMCGPGYLLGEINKRRPDLSLLGVDIDPRYVSYGREKYPGIHFIEGDVLNWEPHTLFDVVVCTGALHHLEFGDQGPAVANIETMADRHGIVIISDCNIASYDNETERRLAAAELGNEYLKATIQRGAPDDVVEWTIDLIHNDVLMHEYKTPIETTLEHLKHFRSFNTARIWPMEGFLGYGDYVHVCRRCRL